MRTGDAGAVGSTTSIATGEVPSPAPAARPGSFDSLRYPQFRLLWVGGLFISLATLAQSIGRGWLARELTGSNAGLGGVLLGFGLPMLVATPWGGVAADRLSKRLVLAVSTGLLVAVSAWIGVAVALDLIEYWMLVVASGLQAVAYAFYTPARMAFIPELVDARAVPNAIVLGLVSNEGTRVAGPAAAGALIGASTHGTEAVFLGGGALILVGLLTLSRLPSGRPAAARPSRSPLAELREGLSYLGRDRAVRLLVATSLMVVMIGYPYVAFLPTVADEIFAVGSRGYGLMSAVAAGGAVVAGLATARLGTAHDAWRLLYVSGAAFGLTVIGLGVAPTFPVAVVTLVGVGAMNLVFQTVNQSLVLELAAVEYHGRIQGLLMLGFSGFGIAALPLGFAADAIGLRTTLGLMGAAVLAITMLSTVRSRQVRRRAIPLHAG
ncbi:MAG TPA: MFS transporter [Acidimicrobiales bacterium]|nr:MFS transporter [Acidimicrobiales bacterium]